MNESNQSPKIKTKENMFINFGFNLIIPVLMLRKGDDWWSESLGNLTNTAADSTLVSSIILSIAIFFPIAYGAYDFSQRKRWNLLSILGVISAILTGGIGLIPGGSVNLFAIKEAAVPAILGILTIVTLNTKRPLVKIFLYNPDIFNVDKIDSLLTENHTTRKFNQLLSKCTWLLAVSFIFSAALNYLLARVIVTTEPYIDKSAFNEEVGTMMAWSFPVISLPCMIVSGYSIWILIRGIKTFTGLNMEDVIKQKSS